eukprot:197275_1
MSSNPSLDNYSQYVTISYIVIYGTIFLFVAVYSAYDVYITHHNEETTASSDLKPHGKGDRGNKSDVSPPNDEQQPFQQSQTNIIDCGDDTETKHDDIVDDHDSPSNKCCGIGCVKFLKVFYRSVAAKKSIYLSLIPHLFDQGTDFGVIWQYYALWQSDPPVADLNNQPINYAAFFYCSIAVITVHKIVSCSVIFALTQSISNVILQVFDLMMVKAIYANYKLRTNEPGNAQKLLQILEGTFESGPQIFISLVFLIKSKEFDGIVFTSLLFSFWSLTSRIISEDKNSVKDKWKEPEFNYKKCPIVNKQYMIRVVFRYVEIMSHIALFALLWVSLGGFAVGIIIGMELLVVLVISIRSKEVMIFANLLYFFIFDLDVGWHEELYVLFMLYKFIFSPVIYMILITIFVSSSFEAWKVDKYHIRHELVLGTPLGLLSFVYCWVTSIALPCFIGCAHFNWAYMQSLHNDITRDFKGLARQGKLHDILNLVSFGMPKKKLLFHDDDGSILHSLCEFCEDMTVFAVFCDIVFELDPNIWEMTNKKGKLCTFVTSHHDHTWQFIRYLVDKYDVDENELVSDLNAYAIKRIIETQKINNIPALIHMKGRNGMIIHRLFEANHYTDFDKFKAIVAEIQSEQPWKEMSDQYGLLCGDVGFNGESVVKYVKYLVDEYQVELNDLFSDNTAFSLFVKYGSHAKEIIALFDVEYDEDETNRKLISLSQNIERYFTDKVDFLTQEQQVSRTGFARSFTWVRAGLRGTVLLHLARPDKSMTVGGFNVVKQLVDSDRSWLRFREDILGQGDQCNLIEAVQFDLEKNRNFMEWMKRKGYVT